MSPTKIPRPSFSPDQFGDTRFDSAADKAKFANGLVRFVASAFKKTLFTRAVYHGLYQRFGHIAHFDRHGFYATWFDTRTDRLEFLYDLAKKIDDFKDLGRYNGRHVELWGDVAEALASDREWLVAAFTHELAAHQAETETAERAQLEALLAKYGTPEQRSPIAPEAPRPAAPAGSRGVIRRDSQRPADQGQLFDLGTPDRPAGPRCRHRLTLRPPALVKPVVHVRRGRELDPARPPRRHAQGGTRP